MKKRLGLSNPRTWPDWVQYCVMALVFLGGITTGILWKIAPGAVLFAVLATLALTATVSIASRLRR